MRRGFIENISKLNEERQELVKLVCEEAKAIDGTYAGAVEYLERFREDCLIYDDEARGFEGIVGAYEVWRDACSMLDSQFKADIEKRKHHKIW